MQMHHLHPSPLNMEKMEKDRIRDHLRREGWSQFTIQETIDTIDDELDIDPESGAFLLELHLEMARKASH
jgi:SOS response regulatory protein OraA/RecX